MRFGKPYSAIARLAEDIHAVSVNGARAASGATSAPEMGARLCLAMVSRCRRISASKRYAAMREGPMAEPMSAAVAVLADMQGGNDPTKFASTAKPTACRPMTLRR